MNAVAGNHHETCVELKKLGANPSNETNYGRNALHVASMKGLGDMVRLLLGMNKKMMRTKDKVCCCCLSLFFVSTLFLPILVPSNLFPTSVNLYIYQLFHGTLDLFIDKHNCSIFVFGYWYHQPFILYLCQILQSIYFFSFGQFFFPFFFFLFIFPSLFFLNTKHRRDGHHYFVQYNMMN